LLKLVAPKFIGCSRGGLDQQACGFPRYDAARNFIDDAKSLAYVLDFERAFGGKGNKLLVRIALRTNNGGRACLLVSNGVGSVSQTRKMELLEGRRTPLSPADAYFGWGTIRR
jgi:hypothetical protein